MSKIINTYHDTFYSSKNLSNDLQISKKEVKEDLLENTNYGLTKRFRKGKEYKIVADSPFQKLQADLAFFHDKTLLIIIDTFSRYLFAYILPESKRLGKDKVIRSNVVLDYFKKTFKKIEELLKLHNPDKLKRLKLNAEECLKNENKEDIIACYYEDKPYESNTIVTDGGTEFSKLKELTPNHVTVSIRSKASLAERVIQTLKNYLSRALNEGSQLNVNLLNKIVDTYNNTKHNTINMSPLEALKSKNEEEMLKFYNKLQKENYDLTIENTKKVRNILEIKDNKISNPYIRIVNRIFKPGEKGFSNEVYKIYNMRNGFIEVEGLPHLRLYPYEVIFNSNPDKKSSIVKTSKFNIKDLRSQINTQLNELMTDYHYSIGKISPYKNHDLIKNLYKKLKKGINKESKTISSIFYNKTFINNLLRADLEQIQKQINSYKETLNKTKENVKKIEDSLQKSKRH